jgi:LytS/YehU family sensor histidine kinase
MKIAPLIFMAFVENAFKHASRDSDTGNRIFIELREEAGRVDFLCENSYEQTESVPGGIGLNNAVRRLDLLYKDRYQLAVKKEQGIYQVIFRLTL